jgi:glycerol-3-phosphate acyltransferase PlsY
VLILAYLSGALPWSVWLGKLFFRVDPRQESDGNPGASNAFRAGGWKLGIAVLILDFLKGFMPVFIAKWGLQLPESQLFWVALMPTLGHAFSVFLVFRGGRALATLFGVWAGLTLYEVPLVMGAAAIVATITLKNDALKSLTIPGVLIAYLLLTGKPDWMVLLALAQLAVLVAKLGVYYLTSAKPDQGDNHAPALKT